MQRAIPVHGHVFPPSPLASSRLAVARKGFRIFFLLAAAYASVIVPIWLLVLSGVLGPSSYLAPPSWHAHEMVFGFTLAVVAGFLLTAVSNWTGRETAVGWPLLSLAALWIAGRVFMLCPSRVPQGVPALVDLAFLPALTIVILRPLIATGNRRNLVMAGALVVLFAANVAMHLAGLRQVPQSTADRAVFVAVDVIVFLMLVVAGRVVPMFTRNATGAAGVRSHPRLDALTAAGAVGLTCLDAFHANDHLTASTAGIVGALAVARATHWGTWQANRHPLLWILHLGYAWLCVGLLLRAASGFSAHVPASLAIHAITVGAIGCLTLGMMARVALGHTGRALVPRAPVVWAFGAMGGAAIARVIVPLVVPAATFAALVAAGTLWTAAFLLYLTCYAPILCSPRADGKVG